MIIGITGTNGAGKGTVVEYLVKEKGFKHYSARDFIVEEIQRRGLPVDRRSMNLVGNDLRALHGPAYVIQELVKRAKAKGGDAVIESVRTVGEAMDALRKEGGILLAVDADPHVRYERVVLRRSETDRVDFDTFVAQEEKEMRSDDPNKQNILGVVALADYRLINDGTREDLYTQIENIFAQGGFD